MGISRAIALTVLLTITWLAQAYNWQRFLREKPPRANVVTAGPLGPAPTITDLANADLSLPFVTKESHEQELAEYQNGRFLHVCLAGALGLATIVLGTLLGEHWAFGLLCLLLGPLPAIRLFYSEQAGHCT